MPSDGEARCVRSSPHPGTSARVYAESGVATAAGSLGGERFIVITRNPTSVGEDSISIGVGAPVADLTSTFCCSAAIWTLFYDGDLDYSFNPIGLGGLDLTDAGASDRIRFSVRANMAVGVSILVTTSDSAQSFGDTFSSPSLSFIDVDVPFADFEVASGATGPADFSHVGAVVIAFGFAGSHDQPLTARLAGLRTVGEPATPGLLLLAGIGCVTARRRRALAAGQTRSPTPA